MGLISWHRDRRDQPYALVSRCLDSDDRANLQTRRAISIATFVPLGSAPYWPGVSAHVNALREQYFNQFPGIAVSVHFDRGPYMLSNTDMISL